MTNFQIVVLGVFVAFIIIGVGVFAIFGGLLGGSAVGSVTIWGTAPTESIQVILETLRGQDKSFQDVVYIEKEEAVYHAELLDAMASGRAPDLFLVSQEEVYSFSDKVFPIPYSAVSQATFTNSFVDEGSLFLTPQGALALPFLIDPLVMYWNRDLFSSAGVASAPSYWNDFLTIAPKITSLDKSSTFGRSAVAMGEWRNIENAKAILSVLFLQAGDRITTRDEEGRLVSVFGETPPQAAENPAASALRFYTEFANPSKRTYSWNKSLPEARDSFAGGVVATYMGFASEYGAIRERNPNLNFGVVPVPQIQGNTTSSTFGIITGLAIPRGARNPEGALAIAKKLTSETGTRVVAGITGLPPVRRDVVLDTSSSAAASVFVESALIARGWLDPDSAATDTIFETMIESVASGREQPTGAVSEAAQEFEQLVRE